MRLRLDSHHRKILDRKGIICELSRTLNAEAVNYCLTRKRLSRTEIERAYDSAHYLARKYDTLKVDFMLGVDYTSAELFSSRYIRLAVAGVPGQMGGFAIDETKDKVTVNYYTRHECHECGWPDLASLSEPFLVTPKIAPRLDTKKYFICPANNGIHVISTALWHDIPRGVREGLDSGCVAF